MPGAMGRRVQEIAEEIVRWRIVNSNMPTVYWLEGVKTVKSKHFCVFLPKILAYVKKKQYLCSLIKNRTKRFIQ